MEKNVSAPCELLITFTDDKINISVYFIKWKYMFITITLTLKKKSVIMLVRIIQLGVIVIYDST